MPPKNEPAPAAGGERQQRAVLAAATAAVALIIQRQSADLSVAELASGIGISERSFHRYFPHKEDVVRPFFRKGLQRTTDVFSQHLKDEPFEVAMASAWEQSWPVEHRAEAATFYRAVAASEMHLAVVLQEVQYSEQRWAKVLAAVWGIEPTSPEAAMAGAGVVAAFRLAWRSWTQDPLQDPMQLIKHNLHLGVRVPATDNATSQ